jgi:polyisoprenoid-binding protein YceI
MSDPSAPATRSLDGLEIPAPGTFHIDPSHTTVGFVARHLMVTKVRGRFSAFDGAVTIAQEPLDSSVEVSIETASVDTRDAGRDEHLRSADFFDVEQHPTIAFRSTGVEHRTGSEFVVHGELTVRDVTRPVDLAMTLDGVVTDPWGNERLAFTASAEVDREQWGLTWNQALETGGVLVSKKVRLEIEGQAVRQ